MSTLFKSSNNPLAIHSRAKLDRIVLFIVFLLVLTRFFYFFTGYLGKNIFCDFKNPPTYEQESSGSLVLKMPSDLHQTKNIGLPDLAKFDAQWYFGITQNGYLKANIHEKHPAANWVFFPLFPASLWGLSHLIPVDLTLLSIVFSNICLFFAMYYIALILRQRGLLESQIKTTLFFLVAYPTAFYFSLPYTESLFLMLSAATIYHGFNRNYLPAFLLAGLSAITRPPGILNIFLTAGLMAVDSGFKFNRQMLKLFLYSLISCIPMGIFLTLMKLQTGSFLAPFKEQYINWYKVSCFPFQNYLNYLHSPYFLAPGGWDIGIISFTLTTLVLIVFFAYFIQNYRQLISNPREFGLFIYGFALIAMPFSTSSLYMVSVVRYCMVSIPFFIYLTEICRNSEGLRYTFALFFAFLSAIFIIAFVNNYYFVV